MNMQLTKTLGEYVTSKTKYLTEGSFACLLGMMGGLVLLCINLVSGGEEMRVTMAFPAEYFFDVLLPPIIFYQGFSVQKGRLFKNTGKSLLYTWSILIFDNL